MKIKIFNFIYFTILLLIAIFLYQNNLLNADEGVIINNAWHMLHGDLLYYDLFEMVAPASFYFLYIFFFLFGASYQLAITVSVLFLIFGAYGIYLILKLLNNVNFLNYIIPLFFTISFTQSPIINHNTYFTVIIIWSIYLFLLFLKKNNLYFLIFSGFLAGLSITFLQHKGLLFLLFTILFLLFYTYRFKIKETIKIIFLYSIFSLIPILIVLLNWPINILWEQLIIFPLFNYWDVNKVGLGLFFFYLLIFIFLLLFIKKKNVYIKYLLAIQASLLISVYTLPSYYHLMLATFPLLIISAFYSISYTGMKQLKIILFLLLAINLISLRPYTVIENFNKTDWFKLVIEKCESDYIYIGPFTPNLYLEFNKKNPTKFNYLKENQSLENHFNLSKERFIESKADCAVLIYYPNILNKFKHTGNNVLEEYIKLNYNIIYNDGVIVIFNKE